MTTSSILLARQPICDRNMKTVGYELLYRSEVEEGILDGDRATATVATNSFFDIGLDQLVGPHRAFLNVTRDFMVDAHYMTFQSQNVVLEILETIEPEPAVLNAIRDARDLGFTIALDDFVYDEKLEPFIELADIIKVEIPSLKPDQIEEHARLLGRPGVRLLAEKVENFDEFEFCRAAGYDYFQGFFFCKPKTIRRKKLAPNQVALIRLMALMQNPEISISDLEEVIEKDVSLSFMLLRMVNSALHSLPRKIESIRQAVVLLGLDTVRRCIALLILSTSKGKPQELLVTALLRARFCELLAETLPGNQGPKYFTVGLFSVLDAIADVPMKQVLESVPLTEEVRSALIERSGLPGSALNAALALERADHEDLEKLVWDFEIVRRMYFKAVRWTAEVQAEMQPLHSVARS